MCVRTYVVQMMCVGAQHNVCVCVHVCVGVRHVSTASV